MRVEYKTLKIIKLTKKEKRFFTDWWKEIFPQEVDIDETKIRYFKGEWVFVYGRGGLYFIPDDLNAWKKAKLNKLVPVAETDYLPYRLGTRHPREVKKLPRGLYSSDELAPIKEKYFSRTPPTRGGDCSTS